MVRREEEVRRGRERVGATRLDGGKELGEEAPQPAVVRVKVAPRAQLGREVDIIRVGEGVGRRELQRALVLAQRGEVLAELEARGAHVAVRLGGRRLEPHRLVEPRERLGAGRLLVRRPRLRYGDDQLGLSFNAPALRASRLPPA